MIVAYEALITPEKKGYSIEFPDVEGCVTQGDDLHESYIMAYDALGLMLQEMTEAGETLPPATYGRTPPEKGLTAVIVINMDNLDFTEDYVTVREACDMLGVTPQRVQALIRSGDIRSTKVGTSRMIEQRSVIGYRKRRGGAGRPKKAVM